MAQNNDTTVGLYLNGKQAEQTLDILREKAENLGKQLEEAVRRGDKAAQKELNESLKKVNQTIKQVQSSTKNVADVMARLDKATPHELRKTLTTLNNQLKHIERGSSAWNEHVAKIQIVKAELDKVNAEMKQSESLLVRMKNAVNNWGASFVAGAASITGIVTAGKKAVQTYAEMQQEEANVRKYTGMTEEQVNHLNDAFKKMDTRTSREELNKLAQEAGRLGLQSEEDVLGFVRAADKINVALDDLGDGATLTLSKLTDIFGDKQALGTERSLLAVGSVINELSQNSTAAAPYLAEFAQRLAGVGAQAHMTIPEIMGFGAVLDSQGQKLEMSSTALSKVIMNLFKDPAKIAKATGLAVEEFSETCKRSTNEGLLMLLERLHELGGIDSLAPVFADMGENGARASAVLAALAGNVDMVRRQQEAANVAFNEAVSIDKEFEVQNTTVQAGLEKARKGFTEMAVTLGKELMPIVSKVISSTSMTMRVMLKVIQFAKEYRTEIIGLAAAVAAYYAIMKAQDAWNAFTGGIKKAIAGVKEFNKALMANPYAAVAALVIALGTALFGFIKRQREAAKAADEHRRALERQQEAERKTASAVGEVVSKYQLMKQEWERLTTAQQKREWLEKNRDAFEQLGLNITNAVDADEAFIKSSDKVIAALKARAKANALQDLYQEKMKQVYEDAANLEDNQTRVKAGMNLSGYGINRERESAAQAAGLFDTEGALKEGSWVDMEGNVHQGGVQELTELGAQMLNEYYDKLHQQAIAEATKLGESSVEELYGSMYATAQTEAAKAEAATGGLVGDKPSGTVTGGTTPVTGGEAVDSKDRLKQLEDAKKKEMAINQVAYLQGEKDYEAYTAAQIQAEVNFNRQKMSLYQAGSTEYLEAQAAMLAAEKKLQDQQTGLTVEAEQKRYADVKAVLDQRYADSELSAKAYQLATEQAELEHLRNLANTYEEGSKERLKAEERYQQRSTAIQQKHAADAKRIQEQLQKAFFDIKELGVTDSGGYAEQLAQLDALYQHLRSKAEEGSAAQLEIDKAYHNARFELAKQYNDKIGMETEDSSRATFEKMAGFLQTEGAKKFMSAFQIITDGIGNLFSSVTDLIEAEVDLQTAQIEKRYDAEIAAAGNNKKVVEQLEDEKQKEISKVKTEAADKEFKMNIFSAIAQGALAAINAWNAGVGAGFPAGLVLGPMMLAMSLAATGVQIAAMKKQHDAAMAQGYASGGYTKQGGKYEPAGVVHAGEWVASQELLANPTAAATIAQLDQAQRTNTIGQLSKPSPSASVSSSERISSPTEAHQPSNGSASVGESLDRLNKTLDGGIYAATTMTGDKGIVRAQRRYNQLMKNKSAK